MSKHILAVEDEPAIREMIRFALDREGFDVSTAEDVRTATRILAEKPADLVLVDWMLPDVSGLELVRRIRKDSLTRHLAIIMLTAKTDEHDITVGLDAGADDYVTKPFSPRELNSRIRALLRRSSDFSEGDTLVRGSLILDAAAHQVMVDSTVVALGHTEFKLLQFLMKHPERVYSRLQLLDHVWGQGTYIDERTVDVHILRLRKALKPHNVDHRLQTVRGAGYKFTMSDDQS